jgi:hypothetical protein
MRMNKARLILLACSLSLFVFWAAGFVGRLRSGGSGSWFDGR